VGVPPTSSRGSNPRALGENRSSHENALLGGVETRRMRRNRYATWLARADPKKASRHALEVKREILPRENEKSERHERVSASDARSGITLGALPAEIWPTVTTPGVAGFSLRETIV